ncbi:C4-dicarboxylate ABC transporter substrate-binding protein [Salinadaptatus halalkaliphilus]|uniref:C4-dicarboxylate ABC transporter substrate-binding protein n=1 Tax=Salinadaptatus halalkaliphilus TaxID=2419781 RepID=A0A4S3TR31_9EURY|nr:TAXI family TRAP transporter solute-binding subunit [Salinadaptatus halalkaliphilus]THE66851.1 C4-dicarboxylate ABC transporter substrate-binding protein [Salinadaptatus halalkaliphilus]
MVENPIRGDDSTGRRAFLTALGAGTTAALAGCLDEELGGGNGNGNGNGNGGGGDGSENLVMVTSQAETGTQAASQGIASTVDSNSDRLSVDAQPSQGTEDNIGRLDREEADIGMIQNHSAGMIMNEEEPYHDLSYQPQQIMNYNDLPWLLVNNQGWTSIDEIEAGARISPTPGQSGTRDMITDALDYVLDDYEVISVEYGEQAGAMQEGQLDVAAITISNFDFEAAWIQEMKQTVDTYVLEWPDDVVDDLQDDPGIAAEPIDMTQDNLEGYAHAPDEAIGINIAYNYIVRDDLEYDAVYEFLETLYDHREEMADDHAYLGYFVDDEWWTARMYDDFPFHPAAADFFQELGVWDDDFVVGD